MTTALMSPSFGAAVLAKAPAGDGFRCYPARVRRIVCTECLRASSVNLAANRALLDQLYAVYSETAHGTTREELEALILGADGHFRLALFYGADDELAGFSYANIECVEHGGRRHAVFNAAVL